MQVKRKRWGKLLSGLSQQLAVKVMMPLFDEKATNCTKGWSSPKVRKTGRPLSLSLNLLICYAKITQQYLRDLGSFWRLPDSHPALPVSLDGGATGKESPGEQAMPWHTTSVCLCTLGSLKTLSPSSCSIKTGTNPHEPFVEVLWIPPQNKLKANMNWQGFIFPHEYA